MARIEAKSMLDRMMCPNLIYSWDITIKIAGDFRAYEPPVKEVVLDNDRIKLDKILTSSNQIVN